MNFGQALKELERGKKVARQGWNGAGMFLYLVQGSIVPFEDLRGAAAKHLNQENIPQDAVTINWHVDMKAADGVIEVGWRPTTRDMFALDWEVIE